MIPCRGEGEKDQHTEEVERTKKTNEFAILLTGQTGYPLTEYSSPKGSRSGKKVRVFVNLQIYFVLILIVHTISRR